MKVRKTRKNRGFSLLELLAVVTILGIIAAVVIPRISVSAGTAKANANAQNIAEINSAVERWYFIWNMPKYCTDARIFAEYVDTKTTTVFRDVRKIEVAAAAEVLLLCLGEDLGYVTLKFRVG